MERAGVIAAAVVIFAVVATNGGAVGFVIVQSDPAVQAQRNCEQSPSGCRNFKVTARTANRVVYAYDQADGSHCEGFEQIDQRGFLGQPTRTSGGASCTPGNQLGSGAGPSPPTYPDG